MKKTAAVLVMSVVLLGFSAESQAFFWLFGGGGGKGGSRIAAVNTDEVFSKGSTSANFETLVIVSQDVQKDEEQSAGTDQNELLALITENPVPETNPEPSVQPNPEIPVTEGRPVPVPEPTTMILLGAGLLGLAAFSRKMIR
ncbi:MAG: PEP-CTERM sorting domain-containing protein [Desulfobacterales bacterium]